VAQARDSVHDRGYPDRPCDRHAGEYQHPFDACFRWRDEVANGTHLGDGAFW
jgi:hypothetical protein